jgi:hypothetical protein
MISVASLTWLISIPLVASKRCYVLPTPFAQHVQLLLQSRSKAWQKKMDTAIAIPNSSNDNFFYYRIQLIVLIQCWRGVGPCGRFVGRVRISSNYWEQQKDKYGQWLGQHSAAFQLPSSFGGELFNGKHVALLVLKKEKTKRVCVKMSVHQS